MPKIHILAAQVAAGHLPPVCARHGDDAVSRKRVRLISKPPLWVPFLLLVGYIPYFVVVRALRKSLDAPAWPWCARCSEVRTTRLVVGFSVLAAGVLLMAYAVVLSAEDAGWAVMFGALVVLLGIFVASFGGTVVVTGAAVSQNGQFVEVAKGSDRFAAALGGRLPYQGGNGS